jgi:DNA topoisomerase-1
VSLFLETHFEPYVDYEFTAKMEDTLDEISRGELHWIPPLMQFWKPFIKRIREKEETVSRQEAKMTRVLGVEPSTGKEVSVRLGRFGAHAQIGSVEDEDKPRFAGLQPGQSLETITLEEALELFKLPRDLGFTPEDEELSVGIGRFGPYIRFGSKFVSLKDADPLTIELPQVLELVAAKKQADIDRILKTFEGTDVQILKGRWGPFIANETKNARMPKDREPDSMTLEECLALLEAAPEKRGRKKAARKKAAGKKATKKKTAKKKTSRKKTAKKKTARKKTARKGAVVKPVTGTASE